MRRLITAVFLIACLGQAEDEVATPKPGPLDKLTISFSADGAFMNAFFMQNLGGLSQSPDWMHGVGFSAKVQYQLARRVGILFQSRFDKINGTGPWDWDGAREIEQAAGVTGKAIGTVNARVRAYSLPGASLLVLGNEHYQWHINGGIMRAYYSNTFTGSFVGNDGQDNFIIPNIRDHEDIAAWRPFVDLPFWVHLKGPFGLEFSPGLGALGFEIRLGFTSQASIIPRMLHLK